jgi:glycosyltransferase involved in cell wall biosynthesis
VEPRKNIASVIAAYRLWRQKYPEIKLVIAGKYGWSVDIANLNHQEREGIIWLRYVTVAQKKALYRLARLFVWPSFYEGFGFPPLEALAQGTPVVTSYTTAMPELLHEQAQYVNPYNYAELEKLAEETRYFNVTFELTRGLIELCACEWERIYVAGPAQWVLLVSGYVSQQYAPLLNEAPWFGRKDRLLGLLRAITGHSRALPDLMSYMVWISRTMPGTLGFWQEYIKTEKETEMEKP